MGTTVELIVTVGGVGIVGLVVGSITVGNIVGGRYER